MKMNKLTTLMPLLFGAIGLGLVSGCSETANPAGAPGDSTEDSTPLVRVTPIRPTRKTLVRWTEQPGQIEAFEETPLYAKLAGFVEKMHVDIGDAVVGPEVDDQGKIIREGQLLAELSVPELAEELEQKQALVGQGQAEVRQATAGIKVARSAANSARSKVDEAAAVIEQTQAEYEFAQSEYTRMKELAKRGSTTGELAEEKEKQFRSADSRRKQTQARVESARAVLAESQSLIEKAEADQKSAEARLRVAEADASRVKALLGYTKIRAPYDGIVTARNVHTGHLVQPGMGSGGKPLLVVAQIRKMRIFVDVPEIDAPLMSQGSEAQVRIPSAPSEPRSGTLTRTAWILDSGSRTLRTEVDLPNEDGKLRPGMYAYAKIKVAERKDALALPKSAVMSADGETFCYTIDSEGQVVRTKIETGIRAGDDIEIVSGLSGGEQVIGINAAAFREGQKVEIVESVK